jgi:hypothetical protein
MTPRPPSRAAALVLAGLLGLAPASAAADERWVLASFSITETGSRWTDEAALESFDRCMDLLRTAVDSDAATLQLAGMAVDRTASTVTARDSRSRRTVAHTVYSCRRDWRPAP